MAAREDVLPDEVRGCAVGLVALLRLRNGLRGRPRVETALPPFSDLMPSMATPL